MCLRRGCEPQVLGYQIIVLGHAVNKEDNTTNICRQSEVEHILRLHIHSLNIRDRKIEKQNCTNERAAKMNGAFELPGEAAPLSPQQVLQALQAASSQQQNLIRSGTAQLQTWETERGYYPMLQVRISEPYFHPHFQPATIHPALWR